MKVKTNIRAGQGGSTSTDSTSTSTSSQNQNGKGGVNSGGGLLETSGRDVGAQIDDVQAAAAHRGL